MFAYTAALGIPVSSIYILARFIYLNNKDRSNEVRENYQHIEKTDKCIEVLLLGEWGDQGPKSRGRFEIESYQNIVEKFNKKIIFKKKGVKELVKSLRQ